MEPNPNPTPITPPTKPTPNTITSTEPNPETTIPHPHTQPHHQKVPTPPSSPPNQSTINQSTIIQPQLVTQNTETPLNQTQKDLETPQQNPEQVLVDAVATVAAAIETVETVKSHVATSVKRGRTKMMARKRKFQRVQEKENEEGDGLNAEEEVLLESTIAEVTAEKEDIAAPDAAAMT